MNREIKFRGKRVDNGEWIYGYYLNDPKKTLMPHVIYSNQKFIDVDPKTVGQFTGLKDKNGKEIYEGDILREASKNDWEKDNYSCFEVFFHDGDANNDYNIGFSMNRMYNHGSVCGGYVPPFKPKSLNKMCIIGNIHDNPELIS